MIAVNLLMPGSCQLIRSGPHPRRRSGSGAGWHPMRCGWHSAPVVRLLAPSMAFVVDRHLWGVAASLDRRVAVEFQRCSCWFSFHQLPNPPSQLLYTIVGVVFSSGSRSQRSSVPLRTCGPICPALRVRLCWRLLLCGSSSAGWSFR